MKQNGKIILASASPRRKELLERLEIQFEVRVSNVDEESNETDAKRLVTSLALQKAEDVLNGLSDQKSTWVIGADTIVVVDQKILGKPANPNEAIEMLSRLSGRVHQVMTGFAIKGPENQSLQKCVVTEVEFSVLSPQAINFYLESEEYRGKAGAYAIQGRAQRFIRSLKGSYSNVVGLPLNELSDALFELGAIELGQA